jgi:hypothetical protein
MGTPTLNQSIQIIHARRLDTGPERMPPPGIGMRTGETLDESLDSW